MREILDLISKSSEAVSLGVIAVVLGFSAWTTQIHLTTMASAETLNQMQKQLVTLQAKIETDKFEAQKEIYSELKEMNARLSRIEGKLQSK